MKRFVRWVIVIAQLFVLAPPFTAQCEAQSKTRKTTTARKATTTKKVTTVKETKSNEQTEFERLLAKAQSGDAEAQYRVAKHYLPEDESISEEGLKWLIMAAANGNAGAQYSLAYAYFFKRYGVTKSDEESIYWLKKCANNQDINNYKQEIAFTQSDLGELYYLGMYGLEYNLSEYFKWKKKAAHNGHAPAACSLGGFYKDKGDKEEAIYWFKKAMDIKWVEKKEEYNIAAKELRELGVRYHPGDNYASNRSSSSSSSSSSSTSSSSKSDNQPNAVGTYTISSQGQSVTTGGFTGIAGPDMTVTVEFYDKGIKVGGIWCELVGTTSNGQKKYSSPLSFGGSSTAYFVDSNYNVQKQDTFSSPYGTDWFNYRVVKGSVSIPKATPYQGGSSYSGGSSSSGYNSGNSGSTQTYQKDCPQCRGTGKCNTCNGTHRYLNPLTNKYVTCPNCTPNGACSACGGSGKKR